ncbi:hypothetical protein DSO57_1022247 [Entomophthora muscae]|uniref:Uncharacterized protein n=1 Tax=Entomophthora muscae TaxID=34485 RepID=A0ACC2UNK8_9FUNG|nr:hypothetical protein DSO57_1022247 [Entomophthora muscae]
MLARDPLARTTKLTRYNQKGPWYVTKSRLFRDKYNFLPDYQLDMEPTVIPRPMPASAAKLPLDYTNKLFGIVYITLTGVIDTIVPAAGHAPILWWALPTQSTTRQFPNASKPADQGWFPENIIVLGLANQFVPHTGSWRPLATVINYLVQIAPIMYMVFQAQPAFPVAVQSDSGMGCDTIS